MEVAFFIMEVIGTVAFALSGAMEAMKHKMDALGVIFLGMTTAVGGGHYTRSIAWYNPAQDI